MLAVAAGLPHGAADVVLLPWRVRPLLTYARVALGALVVTLVFSGPVLHVLLLLSVAHFAGWVCCVPIALRPGSCC